MSEQQLPDWIQDEYGMQGAAADLRVRQLREELEALLAKAKATSIVCPDCGRNMIPATYMCASAQCRRDAHPGSEGDHYQRGYEAGSMAARAALSHSAEAGKVHAAERAVIDAAERWRDASTVVSLDGMRATETLNAAIDALRAARKGAGHAE